MSADGTGRPTGRATDETTGRPAGGATGGARSGRRRDRWEGHREARRQQMAEAAVRAIRRHGARVRMEDIAAEAGVSKPILYRQFEHQRDLYMLIARHAADRLLSEFAGQLTSDLASPEDIARVVDVYLRFVEAEPQLYRFLASRVFLDPPVEPDPLASFAATVAVALGRAMGDRMRAAGLDSGGAEAWGHGLVGFTESTADWWLERQTMSREAVRDYIANFLWSGFRGLVEATDALGEAAKTTPRLRPVPNGKDNDADEDRPGTAVPGGH